MNARRPPYAVRSVPVSAAALALGIAASPGVGPGSGAHAALEWSLEAERVQAGAARFDSVRIDAAADGAVEAQLDGVTLPGPGSFGTLSARCGAGPVRCERGTVERAGDDGATLADAAFQRDAAALMLSDEDGRVHWDVSAGEVRAEAWPLRGWLIGAGSAVSVQDGRLDARVELGADPLRIEGALRSLAFDTADGRYAGADLDLSGAVELAEGRLNGRLAWTAGEALLGPAYLPPPEGAVRVEGALEPAGGDDFRLRLDVNVDAADREGDAIRAVLGARVASLFDEPALRRASLDLETVDLDRAWTLGLESLAARAGWPGLRIAGRLSGRLDWHSDDALEARLEWRDVAIDDPAGRAGVEGLQGRVVLGDGSMREEQGDGSEGVDADALQDRLDVRFDRATLYRLPLGAASWTLVEQGGSLELVEPLRVPLLDGAVRIDRLVVDRSDPDSPAIDLDAAIEPLDLAALTRNLGLPEFGGRLSGRIPGVRLDGGALRVDGGLDLELFSGRARIRGLAIERPFGTLPALSASVEFERLDLAPLTSAFEFGAMQGELEGHVRGLRLLDWQPVAFDAWFYAPADTPLPRRISQRAVDQIASVGGGGSAALSAPLLGLFDEFAYREIGLGCRLAANVCEMRGLDEVEGGGYRIVAGRGIPRLDVVGFRRQVDWPVLLRQLRAATRGEGVKVGN
ncbi:YdbH domain-containing protein [Halomonas denitrificans]|nr:YdbH domain-containing protein [Halomonas denitrificans]